MQKEARDIFWPLLSWLKCHYKDILIDYIQFINEESPLSFPSSDEWLHFSEKNRVATLQSYQWSDALVFAIASGKSVQYPSQGKSSKRSELQENYETMMEQLCKLANKFWKFYDQITIVSQLHRRSKTLKWLENYLNVSSCFRLSILPILVNKSQACLEGISSNVLPMSTMTQWWSDQNVVATGYCDLKNTLLETMQ